MTRRVRTLTDDDLKAHHAARVLLDPAWCRFACRGHSVVRDIDGFWLTDPYGVDVGHYAATRQGATALAKAINDWSDRLSS